jgi:predicted O-methyltransferase YrrM
MQERWDAVDRFIESQLIEQDDALREAAGGIGVSPALGKLLHLLALTVGARRILELGTLHGYSAIWFARALPADGELVTLELDPETAATARANVDRAGVGERVDIRVGPALDSLQGLDPSDPFDLVFIDADKQSMPEYFVATLPLVRPGGLIIGDNTVRGGAIVDDDADERVAGARGFYATVAAEPSVDATALQTVGVKGYDGFVLARKIA